MRSAKRPRVVLSEVTSGISTIEMPQEPGSDNMDLRGISEKG